jgi:drug/metabolite transporter (DMT)-like permease
MASRARGFGAHDLEMLVVTLVWGGNFSISKFAMHQIPPLAFSAVRFLVASLFLLLIARRAGVLRALPRRTFWALVGLGVVGNTIYQTAFMTGLSLTSATNSAMIIGSMPVAVAALGTLLGIERASAAMWLGVALGTAGVALVVSAGGGGQAAGSFRGDLLVTFAVVCWASYTVGIRRMGAGVDPLWITTLTTVAGTPGLLLVGLPGILRAPWQAVTPATWAAAGYSAFLALVLSYVLYNRAVQAIGSGRTALYNCLTPLVAMLIAWVTLGEAPNGVQCLGVALVVAGVLVSVTRPAPGAAQSAVVPE